MIAPHLIIDFTHDVKLSNIVVVDLEDEEVVFVTVAST